MCERRAWDELVTLATRCRQATERGKQLWPIAEHIEYRLALEGPPSYAGAMITPSSGRFALGPLTEVAASTHDFGELAPHLTSDQILASVAQERVLRGEDLRHDDRAHGEVFDLPLVLQAWEPEYHLATYKAHDVEVPGPQPPTRFQPEAPGIHTKLEDPEVERALLDLAASWIDGSEGSASVVFVQGTAGSAAHAVGLADVALAQITRQEAFALMAWAASSAGAHGRRRGAAYGRFAAWSSAAALVDLDWPCDPVELDEELEHLDWFVMRCPRSSGWHLDLVIEDQGQGWAAGVSAHDA